MERIIQPKQVYTYEQMCLDCNRLMDRYPSLISMKTIGYSVGKRKLIAIKLGKGEDKIFINGAHHAREWLTTTLLMDIIETYAEATNSTSAFETDKIKEILNQCSFWFVPMVNPDGVTLAQSGYRSFKHKDLLIEWNKGSYDFSSWKANIRGVDLNRQYPADWETIQSDPGIRSCENFKGYEPLSEPESLAIYQFVQSQSIKLAAAYHSSGEEIFWKYKSETELEKRSKEIALQLANVTGYKLIYPSENPSGGGFTDWFISYYQRPSFTIEIAPYIGPNPVPLDYYASIYQQNKYVPLLLAENRNL
ncbi:Gamma-D-glutamyl-L-diamino acid endopeptidase 1 [Paraliobacillus sp. PM-2]|uniref:M14 family metallopeptidase n=1 Tax=Paraliobacillus sp. PM-2 TaxID=1462524 RepID=UPI00061B8D5F|nr:M14 family metallocarboxypeptidase [Paraliobacillus sp. PM-2]CQR46519.1 Gamma-D-glutamyl-L-diamino acid endopeptidase 1 [Paraliobacillus sp. PM-2]